MSELPPVTPGSESAQIDLRAALWSQIGDRRTPPAKTEDDRECAYRANPEAYERSLDLSAELKAVQASEGDPYASKARVCRRAAENEARIRRSPEVTLDHMFYALLQPGTDSHAFLTEQGVDPCQWRVVVDACLARFADGPRWPALARDLGMNLPKVFEDAVRKGNDGGGTAEEIKGCPRTVPFTDLVWLRPSAKESATHGYALLKEAGITEDAICAAIKTIQTGDPNWFKVAPDLVSALRNTGDRALGITKARAEAVHRAGQFEARRHWAPEIEVDHVLLALLVPGTDTSELLKDLRIDDLAEQVEATLPRFATGPFFPEYSSACRMASLSMSLGKSSDLKFVEDVLFRASWNASGALTPGFELLRRNGVTLELVSERLRRLGVAARPSLSGV